jgi:hypothetical protein
MRFVLWGAVLWAAIASAQAGPRLTPVQILDRCAYHWYFYFDKSAIHTEEEASLCRWEAAQKHGDELSMESARLCQTVQVSPDDHCLKKTLTFVSRYPPGQGPFDAAYLAGLSLTVAYRSFFETDGDSYNYLVLTRMLALIQQTHPQLFHENGMHMDYDGSMRPSVCVFDSKGREFCAGTVPDALAMTRLLQTGHVLSNDQKKAADESAALEAQARREGVTRKIQKIISGG